MSPKSVVIIGRHRHRWKGLASGGLQMQRIKNPRVTHNGAPAFHCCTFDRSVTSPKLAVHPAGSDVSLLLLIGAGLISAPCRRNRQRPSIRAGTLYGNAVRIGKAFFRGRSPQLPSPTARGERSASRSLGISRASRWRSGANRPGGSACRTSGKRGRRRAWRTRTQSRILASSAGRPRTTRSP